MYCSNCGRENPDGFNYCMECGQCLRHEKKTYPPVSNYLPFSIIMIFLCLPFGIAGLVYSLRVDEFLMQGNTEAARAASDKARQMNIIGLIVLGSVTAIGILIAAICLICVIPLIPSLI